MTENLKDSGGYCCSTHSGGGCTAHNDDDCSAHERHAGEVTDLPDTEKVYDLAELFKVFGDSTRLRILSALLRHELCVCDIAEVLGMTQSAISHQLRVLRSAGLVRARREGKQSLYSLDDQHVRLIIEMGFTHLDEKH
jgi:ArsR family transcriptional regulator